MAQNSRIRRVYLLNQDYSFGQQVAKMAREMIAARRPDIEIVGDELHPLGRIKDFVPYAAKIRAAGADTVVTGTTEAAAVARALEGRTDDAAPIVPRAPHGPKLL